MSNMFDRQPPDAKQSQLQPLMSGEPNSGGLGAADPGSEPNGAGGQLTFAQLNREHALSRKFRTLFTVSPETKGMLRMHEFATFEPLDANQQLTAFVQNTFELIALVVSIVLALCFPSLVSIGFVLLAHLPLIASKQAPDTRVKAGIAILGFNLLLLIVVAVFKVLQIRSHRYHVALASREEYRELVLWLQGLGFVVRDVVDLKNSDVFKFEFDTTRSLLFEGLMSVVLLAVLSQYLRMLAIFKRLRRAPVRVMLVKNYELKCIFDGESGDEEEPVDLGTKRLLDEKAQEQKQAREQSRKYRKEMRKMGSRIKRNYMDSFYFQQLNKAFFLSMLLFQLLSVMNFNGLFDVPSMVFILILLSFYALRKSFAVQYAVYAFFLAHYLHISLLLQLLFTILTDIDIIESYFQKHRDSQLVQVCRLLFGMNFKRRQELTGAYMAKEACFFSFQLLTIFTAQAWMQSRWCAIRQTTSDLPSTSSSYERLAANALLRQELKSQQEKLDKQIKAKRKELMRKKSSKGKSKSPSYKLRRNKKTMLDRARRNLNNYLPTLIIWLLRITMAFQVYMYHDALSLLHLSYVLLTCIFNIRYSLFFSFSCMLPVYCWEFAVVYGSRIPVLQDNPYLVEYGRYFAPRFKFPVLEQLLYFVILQLLFMTVSCFKLAFDHDQNEFIKEQYLRLITSKNRSIFWKFLFYVLKHIQTMVLIALFLDGANNINSLRSLGFLMFFVFYSASEHLYRTTSKMLTFFVALFILGQYYVSLFYQQFEHEEVWMRRFEWLHFLDPANRPNWEKGSSIYFRFIPLFKDWAVLYLVVLLNFINVLFVDRYQANAMQNICYEGIRDRFKVAMYRLVRFKNFISSFLIFIVLAILIYYIGKAQTNLISWMFFVLNVTNLAFMAKADNKNSTNERIYKLTNFIKFFSAFVLLLDIFFIVFVGQMEKTDEPASLDQQFKARFPIIYRHLDLIGLRLFMDSNNPPSVEEQKEMLSIQFRSLIAYLLVSVYLSSVYKQRMDDQKGEEDFDELHYKRLFEFTNAERAKVVEPRAEKKKTRRELDESREEQEPEEDQQAQPEIDIQKIDAIQSTKFIIKEKYNKYDLLDFYEHRRYFTPFIVYKWMDWWPVFDTLATYGHLVNGFIIVYLAINFTVSLFMLMNLLCVCVFYMVATYRLQKRAEGSLKLFGLQAQTDLCIANMVTKEHKKGSAYEFLKIRDQVWKLQFTLLVIGACLGFPSTLLYKIRTKLDDDPIGNQDLLQKIDSVTFYVFFSGIYKDFRPEAQNYFYLTFFLLAVGLVIERQAINWLQNRKGCTFNRLQKFIELDLRIKSIKEKWPICPPPYSIDSYKDHYFMHDFNELSERFVESESDQRRFRKAAKRQNQEIRDFVPYNVACRIREFITFSVKLNGRCQDLQIDEAQLKVLAEMDQQKKAEQVASPAKSGHRQYTKRSIHQIDYEDVPVLRQFKIDQLEKILKDSVRRKYKISFFKGVQLAFECLILLILMVSVVLKANVFSLIYLLFILKYLRSRSKTELLVRMVTYMALCFLCQYALFVFNLTDEISPSPFPEQFKHYPRNRDDPTDFTIKYSIPFFFRYEAFRDLKLSFLIGIGIEQAQVQNLLLDFVNLYLVSMYVYHYRNPVLLKAMQKVFWVFPKPSDPIEKWNRVHHDVKPQVRWLLKPCKLSDDKYKEFRADMDENEEKLAERQFAIAEKYNKMTRVNLTDVLVAYVDLKFEKVWSDELCRKKKWEMKEQDLYFRLVKQGSQLVYISFHVVTIMVVMLMAVLRQSFLAIGYVLILLPRIKDGAEVLTQRTLNQSQNADDVKEQIEELEGEIAELNVLAGTPDDEDSEAREAALESKRRALKRLNQQLASIQKTEANKTFEQKQQEKSERSRKQWAMISVIEVYLMLYACIDFGCQILAQLPVVSYSTGLEIVGFRKVWSMSGNALSYALLVNAAGDDGGVAAGTTVYNGLELDMQNFCLQILNCIMICSISLQAEIFNSSGYLKYVTQANGSIDLLVSLSELKAKSIAYTFNNLKIRKIISIQRKKETILATVDKLKEKIKRWREFTRTTLEVRRGRSYHAPDLAGTTSEAGSPLKASRKSVRFGAEGSGSPERRGEREERGDGEERDEQREEEGETSTRLKHMQFVNMQTGSQADFEVKKKAKKKRISKADAQKVYQKLAEEFVKVKKAKLNFLSRVYLFLQTNFVEQIMFQNDEEALRKIVDRHREGEVSIPTELEQIMLEEAEWLIEEQYDHRQGMIDLAYLFGEHFIKKDGQTISKGKSLLQMTDFDRIVKLHDMKRTWEFTRPVSMLFKLMETFFYILISNTQNVIYLCMIFSMYVNAGIISLVYPIAVFGFALLEETRPRKEFWDFVRRYTTFLLFLKFFVNLSVFGDFMATPTFQSITAYLKLGIYDYEDFSQLVLYMLPEVLIIAFIMLHEIQLQLNGLYYSIEQDIETIDDGIQRTIEQGDAEKVRLKKIQRTNMQLSLLFKSRKQQIEDKKRSEYEENQRWLKENPDAELPEAPRPEVDRRKLQEEAFLEITKSMFKQSKQFDVDQSSNMKRSPFDILIKDNVLQKSLETDNLLIVEGQPPEKNADFLDREEIEDDLREQLDLDNVSAGDFDQELDDKTKALANRNAAKLGFFERNSYFDQIFPSMKIQKPGYDLYGVTTFFSMVIAVYVFLYYGSLSVDQANYLKNSKNNNSIFKGDMVICLLVVIAIIITERYVNRSDTKAISNKGGSIASEGEKKSFFGQDEIFKKSSTERSMTVKLKTMKTSELDMQGDSAQDFMRTMYGGEDGDSGRFDEGRTKITTQQKTKYIMHWVILIGVHLFVFWYIPISGNQQLYGTAVCNQDKEKFYGCKNFHQNGYLRVFYVLVCIYLFLSALQLRYGFPIMKKASSVLQYNDNPLALIGANVYSGLPFIVEIRSLLDFTFSKTSLDIFQFWQLWQYHYEMFCAKNGNISYTRRIVGEPAWWLDKVIFGFLFSSIILFLLVGPMVFFSDIGGFVAPNPASDGDVQVAFVIEKHFSMNDLNSFGFMRTQPGSEFEKSPASVDLSGSNPDGLRLDDLLAPESLQLLQENPPSVDRDEKSLRSNVPYFVYRNENPFLRQYDEDYYQASQYTEWTETRFFQSDQLQDCILSEFSDQSWQISRKDKLLLKRDIIKAADEDNKDFKLQLGIYSKFKRDLPLTAKTATNKQFKTLNTSLLLDCRTKQQIQKLADFDCMAPENFEKTISVDFTQAYIPNLILGSSTNVDEVTREGVRSDNLKHDMRLTLTCPDQWSLHGSLEPTVFSESDYKFLAVNPDTCEPLFVPDEDDSDEIKQQYAEFQRDLQRQENDVIWKRVKLTLFSMMVSASFFASYNVTTFYTGVVVMLAGILRPNLIFSTHMGFLYETTQPDAVVKLVEACYMKRHEEDLVGEEECYRMLQEIVRQPELFKALTGSTLKGSVDPILDKLQEDDRKKLEHLQKLERKGFDVSKLKERLLADKLDDFQNL